ncbi:putative chromatin remodeling & transcriptional activation CHROMO-DOMAIN family [Helianthus annuus]|nr:putative chromatin remodeling & transcriptional activation CHROMO-DOMAIN family [Helianthus annuus]
MEFTTPPMCCNYENASTNKTACVHLDDIEVDERLKYIKRLVAIKDYKVKQLCNKAIRQVLVQWQHLKELDLTWEIGDDMREHYPSLFDTYSGFGDETFFKGGRFVTPQISYVTK